MISKILEIQKLSQKYKKMLLINNLFVINKMNSSRSEKFKKWISRP